MGSFLSKLCGNTKKEEDEDDNETNAEKLTNEGSNVDVNSDNPSEPNFLRVDSLARNVERENKVGPIQNTTNTNDGENNIGAQKKKDEQNDRKTNTKKDTSALSTCKYDKKSAAIFLKEMSEHQPKRYSDIGGNFIDTNPLSKAENAIDIQAVCEWLESVGIVEAPRGKFTCFRVGSKYVMTALHCILMLANQGNDCRAFLNDINEERVFVDFHFLEDRDDRKRNMFYFKKLNEVSFPFVDMSTDCIILELEEVLGRQFPPPFSKFDEPNLNNKFTLIHHAGGQIKQMEPVCKIENVAAQGIQDFSRLMCDLSNDFINAKGRDVSQCRCEIPPHDTITNRSRILFHCKCNKGSSGSPGLQVQSDKTVVVVTMMLHGYPDWYYSDKCVDIRDEWNKEHTIEQGANMRHVKEAILAQNQPLFNDIFMPDSRSVDPRSFFKSLS